MTAIVSAIQLKDNGRNRSDNVSHATQSYFMQIDLPKSCHFVKAFQRKLGANRSSTPSAKRPAPACAANTAARTKDAAVLLTLCNGFHGQARANGAFRVLKNFGAISPEVKGCKLS